MTEIPQPWLDEDGFKLMDDDNRPFDCDRCPCICAICDAFGSDSSEWPEGFQRGVRFEAYGVPCSGECGDEPQYFEIDYSDYASQHPGWETCAWRVRDDESPCWHWYAVTPGCEIYEWAYIRDCCPTCYEHSEDPCFETGYRWEVTGIPCGGTCHDAKQTFSVDYSWYHDLHPDWFTCKWCERDGDCVHHYTVDPDCNVVEWATLLDCESSSSGSSSSGSSSSGSSSSGSSSSSSSGSSSSGSITDHDCICQQYREEPAGSIYYADTSCDVEDPPDFGTWTWQSIWDKYTSQGQSAPIWYDRYCGEAKYRRPTNDKAVTDRNVDFFDYDDEWTDSGCVRHWYARMAVWHLEAEVGTDYDTECDENLFPSAASRSVPPAEEDELI